MKQHTKKRLYFAEVLLLGLVCGIIAYPQAVKFIPPLFNAVEKLMVNEGLDLQGGIHLEYKADVSQVPSEQVSDALSAAEAVIERRVNAFGVGEPLVQLSRSGTEQRIIVELPGIKDIEQAKKMIKETPFLEFRELAPEDSDAVKQFDTMNAAAKEQAQVILERARSGEDFGQLATEFSQDPGSKDKAGDLDFVTKGTFVPEFDAVIFDSNFKSGEVYPSLVESQFGWHIIKKIEERPAAASDGSEGDAREVRAAHILFIKRSIDQYPELQYVATGLTGKNLKKVSIDYQSQGIGSPQVALEFDSDGATLLAEISKRNVGKQLAIFIDHEIFSAPTIQQELLGGKAVVTSNFTSKTVNEYVKRLNEGALPVPIALVSQQSVDASLGQPALQKSLFAGLVGLGAVAIFMIFYYRFLGLIAVFALLLYTAMLLTIFKLSVFTPFAITVTLSGIAGFILSIGIAVDANVLIFERTREELSYGKGVAKSIKEGFRRAWPSIRDGHVSTLITTFILIGTGTGFVKGFAIILALGVLLSLFTAVVLVRVTMDFLIGEWMERHPRVLVSPKKLLE
ncbi:MAG: protein-export membrane protein SecD [Candidatus Moranbacteria bacterium RIFCSPHIGHO2_01_FULL_54_31]|nr:MAG: protein-export membrane protein SecD [Candidatus Moranbacteria bacterium RIFCSPHIGHO2_01_FULL_54_31]